MKRILFLLCYLLGQSLFAQVTKKGVVLDNESKDPLPFVNISFQTNRMYGTTTDIDGKFKINTATTPSHFNFSYVGYKNLQLPANNLPDTIYMDIATDVLATVDLSASYNPAHRIIKKAVENKRQNNPNRLNSYEYHSYNKLILEMEVDQEKWAEEKGEEMDSADIKVNEFLSSQHMAVLESVNKKRYLYPETHEEEIIGSKVSGFSDPRLGIIITDFQPFSFYEDNISLLNVDYLNPISKGSLSRYDFQLEESLLQDNDTLFIISYTPSETANIEGMKGVLTINSNGYAVQNVIAEPADPTLYHIRIEQLYELQSENQWFPSQINYSIKALAYPTESIHFVYNGRSYINEIKINPTFEGKLNIESVAVLEGAGQKDDAFWAIHRNEILNAKEQKTYHFMDSLGEKYHFDLFYNIGEQMSLGRIPLGPIDIDYRKMFTYNEYEGTRAGIGLHTSRKLFKPAIIGGYWAYGFKDQEDKYGADVEFFLHQDSELRLKVSHMNDVLEPGRTQLSYPLSEVNLHTILIEKMDRLKEDKVALSFRTMRYAQLRFSLAQQELTPLHNYIWLNDFSETYQFTEMEIDMRYAHKERIVKIAGERLNYRTDYPVVYLNYKKGFDGFLEGNYNYDKAVLAFDYNFLSRNLGRTELRFELGKLWGEVPPSKMFFANGSYLQGRSIVIPKSFQTMGLYEFISDEYVSFYFSHNFGTLLYKAPKHISRYFDPEITIVNNVLLSNFSQTGLYVLPDVKVANNLFLEGGVQLDHLFKVNMLNAAYLGFGAGVFARYGPYAFDDFSDNILVKLSVKASF